VAIGVAPQGEIFLAGTTVRGLPADLIENLVGSELLAGLDRSLHAALTGHLGDGCHV
jgi:hypothetical protein